MSESTKTASPDWVQLCILVDAVDEAAAALRIWQMHGILVFTLYRPSTSKAIVVKYESGSNHSLIVVCMIICHVRLLKITSVYSIGYLTTCIVYTTARIA